MALAILSEPVEYISAYQPIEYLVHDSGVTSTALCISEIQVQQDQSGEWVTIGSQNQNLYRDSSYFKFNVSQFLRDFLTFDNVESATSKVIISGVNSSCRLRVKFTYYEKDVDGVYQEDSNVTSSTVKVFNSIMDNNTLNDDFLLGFSSSDQFLTKQKTHTISEGEHLQLHAILDEDQQSGLKGVVRSYPLSGSPSNTDVDVLPYDHAQRLWTGNEDLTTTPTFTGDDGISIVNFPDSNGVQRVAVKMNASGYFVVAGTGDGKLIKFDVFAHASGNIRVTHQSGGLDDQTATGGTGYRTVTMDDAVEASSTSFRVQNLTGDVLYILGANLLEEDNTTVKNARCVLSLNEYDSTLSKVIVWLENSVGQHSEFIEIFMSQSCGVRLEWLNTYGGIDSFSFTGSKNTETQSNKTKVLNEAQEGERGIRTVFQDSNDVVTVYSEYLTDSQMIWLSELVESKEVWMVNAYNDKTLVDVVTGDFPKDSSKLRQASVSFRLSNPKTLHNG